MVKKIIIKQVKRMVKAQTKITNKGLRVEKKKKNAKIEKWKVAYPYHFNA